jgi:hypothetical protein
VKPSTLRVYASGPPDAGNPEHVRSEFLGELALAVLPSIVTLLVLSAAD